MNSNNSPNPFEGFNEELKNNPTFATGNESSLPEIMDIEVFQKQLNLEINKLTLERRTLITKLSKLYKSPQDLPDLVDINFLPVDQKLDIISFHDSSFRLSNTLTELAQFLLFRYDSEELEEEESTSSTSNSKKSAKKSKLYSEAKNLLDKALKIQPDNFHAHHVLSKYFMDLNKRSDALSHLMKSVNAWTSLDSSHAYFPSYAFQETSAQLLMEFHKWKEAIPLLIGIIDALDEPITPLYLISMCYLEIAQYVLALESITEAIELANTQLSLAMQFNDSSAISDIQQNLSELTELQAELEEYVSQEDDDDDDEDIEEEEE